MIVAAALVASMMVTATPAHVPDAPGRNMYPIAGEFFLTSRYGETGANWGSYFHDGLDFAAPEGTPVAAIQDGTITAMSHDRSAWHGIYVEVTHDDGTRSDYSHLNATSSVYVGMKVKAGSRIGYEGSTGNSTGPHLHLRVFNGLGQTIDPYVYLSDGLPEGSPL